MCASSSINAHIYGIILNTIECDKNRLTISRFRQNSFRFYVFPQSFIPIAVRARMIRLIKLEYNRTRSIRYHESEIQRRSGRASTLATFSYSSADETRGEGGKDDGISSGSEDYLSLSLPLFGSLRATRDVPRLSSPYSLDPLGRLQRPVEISRIVSNGGSHPLKRNTGIRLVPYRYMGDMRMYIYVRIAHTQRYVAPSSVYTYNAYISR